MRWMWTVFMLAQFTPLSSFRIVVRSRYRANMKSVHITQDGRGETFEPELTQGYSGPFKGKIDSIQRNEKKKRGQNRTLDHTSR